MLFALLSRDFQHIREKTHSNTTNLVVSRHIARKKVHFRLTCIAQKCRCLNCLKTVTVGKHLPAPFITPPPPLPTLSSLHREIGSLSNNDGNDYEKVTSKVNSRCLKFYRAYNTSFQFFFKKKNLSNKPDRNILKKLISTDCPPLTDIIPVQKTYVHNLRKKGCARPKINTERFMNTFVNRIPCKQRLHFRGMSWRAMFCSQGISRMIFKLNLL